MQPASPGSVSRQARRGKLLFLILACFLVCCSVVPARAEGDPYLHELLARARERQLYRARPWEVLLHYRHGWFGVQSLIDDPAFFLAENGKEDPAAELAATLTALFAPPVAESADPRCRFVARYDWLQEALDIDPRRLPAVACPQYEKAMAAVRPKTAVLIFPGSSLNSPASLFGHTLLGIEGPYRSKLLAYAVNYAAFTDEANGITYAFKGILGLYRGYYSLLPYYEKAKEYGDLERRDIWEYKLNLSPEETARMLRHIWELRDIASDYYFFDENCSFDLLFLLEAARPSLQLTESTRPWVIPIDTVRLVQESGLVEKIDYRPSKATRIKRLAAKMNGAEQELTLQVIAGARRPDLLPEEESDAGKRHILELAAEVIEYRYFRRELSQDEYRQRYLDLLTARSRLGSAADSPVAPAAPVRPDQGHGSNRLGLGFGWWKGDRFLELRLRPAYHDLLDNDAGYDLGAQIDFLNLVGRFYPDAEKAELHALDLIDIISLSPRNRFFRPISWKLDTGFAQQTFADGSDHLAFRLNPGGGLAWGGERGLVYTLLESDLRLGGRFRDGFAAGLGASARGAEGADEQVEGPLLGAGYFLSARRSPPVPGRAPGPEPGAHRRPVSDAEDGGASGFRHCFFGSPLRLELLLVSHSLGRGGSSGFFSGLADSPWRFSGCSASRTMPANSPAIPASSDSGGRKGKACRRFSRRG